jgi:hypothetical protein
MIVSLRFFSSPYLGHQIQSDRDPSPDLAQARATCTGLSLFYLGHQINKERTLDKGHDYLKVIWRQNDDNHVFLHI